MARFWLISGYPENWDRALSDRIWGVRDKKGLKRFWDNLQKGDILFFYVTSPISGIIGFGIIETKFKQDKPLWPDEIREKKVIYPYRFEFAIEHALPQEKWKENKISVKDLKIGYQAGLTPVKHGPSINKLLEVISKQWGVDTEELKVKVKKLVKKKKEKKLSLHDELKEKIYEIGKVKYISEKEYSMDGANLDVVWRKVVGSVPTYAFEIQIGGNFYQALAKLKHASDIWNSKIYIVIKKEDRPRLSRLLVGTFHEIKEEINIVPVERVEELFKKTLEAQKVQKEMNLA